MCSCPTTPSKLVGLYLRGGTPDKIVWEFNNLYVLSQTPSCMPIEAWVHYFGLMDSAMTEEEYSLYEKYIETINFVHHSYHLVFHQTQHSLDQLRYKVLPYQRILLIFVLFLLLLNLHYI